MNDWQIEFFGKDFDSDSCEALLHTRWPDKELRAEPALFGRKHWDTRHWHPTVATYAFAHIFTEETRRFIRAHIDDTPPRVLPSGRILDWFPLKSGDILEPPKGEKAEKAWKRKTNALIRARQWADHFGIPYTFALRRALRHYYLGRNYIFEHRELPGPDMLNGEECRIAVAEAWLEELGARIQHATHPRYLLVNDVGHRDVAEHQRALCRQISAKADPVPALRKFMGMGLLSAEVAREFFTAAQITRATA